ncbi:hypothetical protein M8818_005750 [Zalaria obscura]|uniref:Uncharacterized protein n=1 Tax=Zalaria obscura TaxID=2024903 RepID=A0ACC3S8W8_9PEZI
MKQRTTQEPPRPLHAASLHSPRSNHHASKTRAAASQPCKPPRMQAKTPTGRAEQLLIAHTPRQALPLLL